MESRVRDRRLSASPSEAELLKKNRRLGDRRVQGPREAQPRRVNAERFVYAGELRVSGPGSGISPRLLSQLKFGTAEARCPRCLPAAVYALFPRNDIVYLLPSVTLR